MASKFIKIYNDTVLKQTILQGYETQRTNPNLGKISMGELAFTRDTGRVFVGNFSSDVEDKELPLDTRAITGGILTGNKYIGLIDSKPLGHWSTTGSNGTFPLNYSSVTTDSSTEEEEQGLFLSGSRFRPYKKDSRNNIVYEGGSPVLQKGGDGWDKSAEYIQKYGVYSGDFAFDVFSNALIIFDKNIKPGEEINRKWENGKEIFLNDKNEDITATAIRRTKIENHPDSKTSEYPIYGDGYVMMRILEPDGITIDYMDRQFNEGVPYTSSKESETYAHLQWPNWTHNILKVNYPAVNIFNEACDKNAFFINGAGKITLKTEGLKITGTSTEMPSEVTYSSGLTLNYQGSLSDISNGYLSVDSDGKVKPKELKNVSFSIRAGNGLAINDTPNGSAILSEISPNVTISIVQDDTGATDIAVNPWGLTEEGSWAYSGTSAFGTAGTLSAVNQFEKSYIEKDDGNIGNDFNSVVTNLWDSTYNEGINLLKNPYPIQANTSSVKGRFIISPCIANLGSGNTGTTISPSVSYSSTGKTESVDEEVEYKNEETGETEINKITTTTTTYLSSLKGFINEDTGKVSSAGLRRIPKHASSVLLEVHHLETILVQSSLGYGDFSSLTTARGNSASSITSGSTSTEIKLPSITSNNKVLLRATGSGIDTVEVPLITIKEESYTVQGSDVETVSYTKFFQYGIITSGNVLINVIGYRV